MLTGHEVQFVDDQEMPDGHDWLLIDTGRAMICAVRHSRLCPEVLEEAWAGYRLMAAC